MKMFSLKIKVCCIIYAACTIFDITAQDASSSEGITVVGSFTLEWENLKNVNLSSIKDLNKNPTSRRFEWIWNFAGHLPMLRKDSVTDLPNLKSFRISGHTVETIEPGAFKNLPKLKKFLLIFSGLKAIEEGVFNDLPIVDLDFRGDDISSISTRAFDNMTALERIDLSYNPLSHWDENWFYNTPRLIWFYTLDNLFKELPKNAFKNFGGKNDVSITIRNNPIRTIGDDLFATPTNVTLLDLSANKIENFGENVLNDVQMMGSMNLLGNEIHCFSGNLSRIFISKEIKIGLNPIDCGDCVKKLDDWEKTNSYRITYISKERRGKDC